MRRKCDDDFNVIDYFVPNDSLIGYIEPFESFYHFNLRLVSLGNYLHFVGNGRVILH